MYWDRLDGVELGGTWGTVEVAVLSGGGGSEGSGEGNAMRNDWEDI